MTRRSCDDLVEAVEARAQYRHRTCCECGGTMKVIACIENPVVIEKILAHLQGGYLGSNESAAGKSGATG